MKFITTTLIFLLLTTISSASLTEQVKKADKQFEKFLETVDDSVKTDLLKQYRQKKDDAIKKAQDKVWEESKTRAEKYMKKYGTTVGNQLLNNVTKQKDNIQKGIDEALKVVSGDAEPEDLYAMSMQWGANKYLKSLFPSIGIIIEMSQFANEQLNNLVDEIYQTNSKTLAKRMLKDKPLFELTGQPLNDYLLKNYVEFGTAITQKEKLTDRRDLLAVRSFFVQYAQREKFTSIGIKDKGNLYNEKKQAATYILRHFLQSKVSPIHKRYVQIQEAKLLLKQEINLAKDLLNEPTKEELDDEIGDDFYRYIEPWIGNPSNRIIDMPTLRAPNSKKDEKDRTKRKKIKKLYSIEIQKLNQIQKMYTSLTNKSQLYYMSIHWKETGIINYNNITLPLYLNKTINAIDSVANKLAYSSSRSFKIDQFLWERPDIFYFIEARNTQIKSLKNQQIKLDTIINSQKKYISALEKLINEVKQINYVGLHSYDTTIYNEKKALLSKLYKALNSTHQKIDFNTSLNKKIKTGFDHFVNEDLAYQKATKTLDNFKSAITSFNADYNSVVSFKPAIVNLNSLSSERINYQVQLFQFLSSLRGVFSSISINYPYTTAFENLIKTNVAFIENSYENYFSSVYFNLVKKANAATALNKNKLKELTNASSISTMQFPFYKNRSLETTQEFVNQKRHLFEERLIKRNEEADLEKIAIAQFKQQWTIYKQQLEELIEKYNKQHTFSLNLNWQKSFNYISETNTNKINTFNALINTYDLAYQNRLSQLEKQKREAIIIDQEENDRIFLHFSKLKLSRLRFAAQYPEAVRFEMKQSKAYFDIYLITDIGRAKTLYLYFYSKLQQAQKQHEEVELIYSEPFHASIQDKADELFSDSFDFVIYLESNLNTWELLLENEISNINELKDSVDYIDNTQPVMDVVYGRLDSDADGVPDNIELAIGTDPINGVDSINTVTKEVTIPAGQGVVFESGAVGLSPSGDQVASYAHFGNFGWSIHGENFIDMTGQESVPNYNDGGYSIGGFISDLSVGKVYAMYYPQTKNYVKIEILAHDPGNFLTIIYSINIEGETF